MMDRNIYGGLVRLHILHHAGHSPVYGVGIMEELGRHGYKLSAGTLYPILHGMEKAGYLVSSEELVQGRIRRCYVATESGKAALALAKDRVQELFRELYEDDDHPSGVHRPGQAKPRSKSAGKGS
jgi:DNA-binding PadR family transcriptional regulator